MSEEVHEQSCVGWNDVERAVWDWGSDTESRSVEDRSRHRCIVMWTTDSFYFLPNTQFPSFLISRQSAIKRQQKTTPWFDCQPWHPFNWVLGSSVIQRQWFTRASLSVLQQITYRLRKWTRGELKIVWLSCAKINLSVGLERLESKQPEKFSIYCIIYGEPHPEGRRETCKIRIHLSNNCQTNWSSVEFFRLESSTLQVAAFF